MRLDEAIVNNFDEAQQAALAAELGVGDAGVAWAESPEPAAALVETLARRGRSADLLLALAAARPAVPWAELPYPHATLRRLHATLVRRHSLDGLRSLCFRLGIDFDDLPGETKDGRARELVLYMDRAGRTGELWENYKLRSSRKERQDAKLGVLNFAFFASLREALNSSGDGSRLSVTRHSSLLILLAVALAAVGLRADGPRPAARSITAEQEPAAATTTGGQSTTPTPAVDEPRASRLGRAAVITPAAIAALVTPSVTQHSSLDTRHSPAVLVGDRGANLRAGPGPGYAVVVTLRAGARLELRAVSPTGEWYQVRLPGQGSPWIDSRYATVVGRADVPVASLPAPPSPTPQATAANQPARPASGSPAAPTPRPTTSAAPTRTPAPTSTAAAPPPTPTQPPP